jgi:hypothetical protein
VPTLTNSLEGGTNGAALTAGAGGNTGGTSGSYFDTVNLLNATATFTTALPLKDSVSAALAVGGTAGQAELTWSTQLGPQPVLYARAYFSVSSLAAAQLRLFTFYNGSASLNPTAYLDSGGHIQIGDDAGIAYTSTVTVAVNQAFRLEFFAVPGTTAGQIGMRLFTGANIDGTTPDDSFTSPANRAATGTAISQCRAGLTWLSTYTSTTVKVDDYAVSTAGWLGPTAAAAVPPNIPARLTPPGRRSPMALRKTTPPPDPIPPAAVSAPAGLAAASAAAPSPAVAIGVTPDEAGVFATAPPPVASAFTVSVAVPWSPAIPGLAMPGAVTPARLTPPVTPAAGLASATATAPAPKTAAGASAGQAQASAVAPAPTVATAAPATAPAGLAAATAAGPAPATAHGATTSPAAAAPAAPAPATAATANPGPAAAAATGPAPAAAIAAPAGPAAATAAAPAPVAQAVLTAGPAAGTAAADLGDGAGAWVNTGNVLADDGALATWTAP